MDLIATMEVQLQAIKQARAEHDRQAAELVARERAAATRTEEIRSLEAELIRRDGALAEREAALAEAAAAMEAERSELARLTEQLAQREGEAAQMERALVERQTTAEQRLAALEAKTAEMDAVAEAARSREAATAAEAERVARLKVELDAEAAQREQTFAAKEAELAEAARALESSIAHTSDRAGELAKERERFEHERSKASALAAEREKTIAAVKAELEQARKALKDEKSSSAERKGAAEARLDELGAERAALAERAAALEAQVAARDAAIEALRADAAASVGGDDEASVALRQEIEGKQSAIEALQAERARLTRALDEAEGRAAALEEQAAAGGATAGADGEAVAAMEQEISKRDLAIEKLRERLKTAKAETEMLLEQAAAAENGGDSGGGFGVDVDAGWAQTRRDRLRRYKRLLREQSRKILQARAALSKRHEQYEQLLLKRAELAEAKRSLEKVTARIQKSAGRNKAAVAMLCIVVALALLGALSYAVAQRIAEPDYLVQAMLAPQPQGGGATVEQLESWQRYIDQLARDPRLMEVAADRMKRRGMAELGTPAAVADLLSRDLDLSSNAPGELTASLRGAGAERTRRILDTYLASMVAVANDGRERRADGATTAVVVPPTPRPEPLTRPHLVYAGGIWAGAAGIMFVGGMFLWRRMARATRLFDDADPSLHALDEAGWPTIAPPGAA